jgi:YHS domain-containing protein
LTGSPPLVQTVWGAIIGPVIAILSFVCSVGNIPLAAVLWSGGLSFAGVLAFIFADLIVLPIIVAYRKYYGNAYAMRIVALMFVTMVISALIIDLLFGAVGLIPAARPSTEDVFGMIKLDYKAVLNAVASVAFIALFVITARRGAKDPVCGMSVDKSVALSSEIDGKTWYFCGPGCQEKFTPS